MFKKIISMIAAAVVAVSSFGMESFAENKEIVYDENGNAIVLDEHTPLVVIRDQYGNIVNSYTRSDIFVEGAYTIPAYGSMTTYTYESHSLFFVGFQHSSSNTTQNKSVRITAYKRQTVSGSPTVAAGPTTFSTSGPSNGNNGFVGQKVWADSTYTYFYGVYENPGSTSITLQLEIGRYTS